MKIVVFDTPEVRANLLPITYTRPVGDIRLGIDTMAERWQAFLPGEYTYRTAPYLTELYPAPATVDSDTLWVAGNVVATAALAEAVKALGENEELRAGEILVARRGDIDSSAAATVIFDGEVDALAHVYDIFGLNGRVLEMDFRRITAGRSSIEPGEGTQILGPREALFIEEGAAVDCATINTRMGPVYIGRDATVMEGCHLRGPIAMCRNSVANMGCKIYGATTLGPWCKVGGELNNVVMLGFANKAHDGFLGNAVIGEWCNLGGGTVASNLKNDYSEIKLWNYPAGRFMRTGLQFCGLIMGDHSKSAINTSFNTATTVGVGCNIISEGMPRVFIPSFTKGGSSGFDNVNLNEFFAIEARVMARRGRSLTEAHKRMFHAIAEYSDTFK